MKRLLLLIPFTLLIVLIVLFNSVMSPGGGCPEILGMELRSDITMQEFKDIRLESCGVQDNRGNLTIIRDCLADAMDSCAEKKALITIQGFENRWRYLFVTDKTCRVLITAASCFKTTTYCEGLPDFSRLSRLGECPGK